MKISHKLVLIFWVCLARPSQSTHNLSNWLGVMPISLSDSYKKIDHFSETSFTRVRKYFSVATAFVFCCNAKHIFYGGPVMFVVTYFVICDSLK